MQRVWKWGISSWIIEIWIITALTVIVKAGVARWHSDRRRLLVPTPQQKISSKVFKLSCGRNYLTLLAQEPCSVFKKRPVHLKTEKNCSFSLSGTWLQRNVTFLRHFSTKVFSLIYLSYESLCIKVMSWCYMAETDLFLCFWSKCVINHDIHCPSCAGHTVQWKVAWLTVFTHSIRPAGSLEKKTKLKLITQEPNIQWKWVWNQEFPHQTLSFLTIFFNSLSRFTAWMFLCQSTSCIF